MDAGEPANVCTCLQPELVVTGGFELVAGKPCVPFTGFWFNRFVYTGFFKQENV